MYSACASASSQTSACAVELVTTQGMRSLQLPALLTAAPPILLLATDAGCCNQGYHHSSPSHRTGSTGLQKSQDGAPERRPCRQQVEDVEARGSARGSTALPRPPPVASSGRRPGRLPRAGPAPRRWGSPREEAETNLGHKPPAGPHQKRRVGGTVSARRPLGPEVIWTGQSEPGIPCQGSIILRVPGRRGGRDHGGAHPPARRGH